MRFVSGFISKYRVSLSLFGCASQAYTSLCDVQVRPDLSEFSISTNNFSKIYFLFFLFKETFKIVLYILQIKWSVLPVVACYGRIRGREGKKGRGWRERGQGDRDNRRDRTERERGGRER